MSEGQKDTEQSRRDAARRRTDEISAKLKALAIERPTNYAELFRLFRELNEVGRILGETSAVEADAWAKELVEQEKVIAESVRVTNELTQEPTPEEQVMIAFAKRLASRQGTVAPDFEQLYRRKAELDRKTIHDSRP